MIGSAASGCTHASVSSVPVEIPGVGTVYRYQGRANFPHQIAEADRMMTEDCQKKNGGHPVVVNRSLQDLGAVALAQGQSNTTATGQATPSGFSATSATSSSGSATSIKNTNQEILYKCVTAS
jgi:hypothetical protein